MLSGRTNAHLSGVEWFLHIAGVEWRQPSVREAVSRVPRGRRWSIFPYVSAIASIDCMRVLSRAANQLSTDLGKSRNSPVCARLGANV